MMCEHGIFRFNLSFEHLKYEMKHNYANRNMKSNMFYVTTQCATGELDVMYCITIKTKSTN